jgi:hypothetical protein
MDLNRAMRFFAAGFNSIGTLLLLKIYAGVNNNIKKISQNISQQPQN